MEEMGFLPFYGGEPAPMAPPFRSPRCLPIVMESMTLGIITRFITGLGKSDPVFRLISILAKIRVQVGIQMREF